MEVFNDLDVSFEKVELEDRVKCIKCIKGNQKVNKCNIFSMKTVIRVEGRYKVSEKLL